VYDLGRLRLGDGEWELNVSDRERVVFYGQVLRL